ncbi:hypothetical protein [Pseudomonas putida]|uniref:hypothetical protein n=1 Tax=Pseudomonas putida TaxID=303 RepID=UPI001C228442|nr:hypothetical protein [Pseudomonas putida]
MITQALINRATAERRMLTAEELAEINRRFKANADRLIAMRPTTSASKLIKVEYTKRGRGRPTKIIENPFAGHIGHTTEWGQYPGFALDIVEGVARLDWHDRPEGKGGKSMPLSTKTIFNILGTLPEVTAAAVETLSGIGKRHAQRYVKAIELVMPRLIASRPRRLSAAMN